MNLLDASVHKNGSATELHIERPHGALLSFVTLPFPICLKK